MAKQIGNKAHLDGLINQCAAYRDSALLFEAENKNQKEEFLHELDNLSLALGQLKQLNF